MTVFGCTAGKELRYACMAFTKSRNHPHMSGADSHCRFHCVLSDPQSEKRKILLQLRLWELSDEWFLQKEKIGF